MKTATNQNTDHAAFSRKLKVYFDDDVKQLVEVLKKARKLLFVQGVSPEEFDNELKKWEV